jgi:hypothetical protein
MKKVILALLFITLIASKCNKRNEIGEPMPDISGTWYMRVYTVEVPMEGKSTQTHYLHSYDISFIKMNESQYKYKIENSITTDCAWGSATYNLDTREFVFDTFYERGIHPGYKGHFTGKVDSKKNTIEGNLFVKVRIKLKPGINRSEDIQTTFKMHQ